MNIKKVLGYVLSGLPVWIVISIAIRNSKQTFVEFITPFAILILGGGVIALGLYLVVSNDDVYKSK